MVRGMRRSGTNRRNLSQAIVGSVGGQRFEVPIADFFEVRDGLIVYDLGVFDNAGRPCRQ